MATREEMVEKAAEVVHDIVGQAQGDTWTMYKFAPASQQDLSRADARAILDAVLPQVSTVEELEALPDRSLLDDGPSVYRWRRSLRLLQGVDSGYDYDPSDVFAGPTSLTVVWQP